jgi:phosphoglycerate dehydrogenase-like enzyme
VRLRIAVTLIALTVAAGTASTMSARAAQSVDERTARLIAELGLQEAPTALRDAPGWKPPARVLVSGITPEQVTSLRAVADGVEVIAVSSTADARTAAPTADALLGLCDPSIIQAGPRIRWVQSFSAGVEDCLRTPLIRDRGILLTNMQRVLGPSMAEHVMAMALAFARRLPAFRDQQRQGVWQRSPPNTAPAFVLDGRTMLVVGLGGIGTEVARRAHAFGMTITAIRNSDRPGPAFVSKVGQSAALLEFARDADLVVNTLPLTDETRNMFDAKVFAAMKRTAWFINVGRGQTVVTADLVKALQTGTIAGAGLDVVEPEPLPSGHPLWSMPNVIITPHVAPVSDIDQETRWLVMRENLRRYVTGAKMLSVVDVARGY